MKNLYFFVFFVFFSISISAQIEFSPPVLWENFDMPPAPINKFVESNGRLWATNGNVYYYEEDEQKWIRKSQFVYSNVDNIVATDFGVAVSRNRSIANHVTSATNTRMSWRTIDSGLSFDGLRSFSTNSYSLGYDSSSALLRKSANEIIELGWKYPSIDIVLKSYTPDTEWSDYDIDLGYDITMRGRIISQDTFIIKYTTTTDSLRFAFFTDDYDNPEIIAIDSIISDLSVNGLSYKYGRLMVMSNGRLLHSSDFGENWSTVDYNQIIDTTNVERRDIREKENFLEIRRDGQIWKVPYSNLTAPELLFETDIPFYDYEVTENFYILNTRTGVYLRRHEDVEFSYQTIGLEKNIIKLLAADSTIYAISSIRDDATFNGKVPFKSTNGIDNWELHEGFDIENIQFLTAVNGIYFRGEGNTIYQSNNQGQSWSLYTTLSSNVNRISTNNGTFFYSNDSLLFTANGVDFITGVRPESGVIYGDETKLITFNGLTRYISIDMGQSWETSTIDSIMPGNIIYTAGGLTSIQHASGNPWSDIPGEVFRSEDDGNSWEKVNEISVLNGYIVNGNNVKFLGGRYLTHNKDLIFLGMNRKVVVSNDGGYTYYYLSGIPFSSRFVGWNDVGPHTYGTLSIPKGFVIDNDMLVAYTTDTGIYRTSLSSINEGIEAFENFTKQISGKAYIDINYNCIFDEEDMPLVGRVINFDEYVVSTDADGNYSIELPAQGAAYEFETENLQYHYLDCLPDNQEIEVVYGSEAEEQDFAFQPFEVFMDTIVQGVCIGEEWLGNIITQDTVWIDTVLTETQILLTIYETLAVEDSETEVFLSITEPQIVGGTIVLYDTMFTNVYEDYYGCDSTVTFNVDILSNVKEYDNQGFIAVLHPNPTLGSSVLFINSAENKVVDIDVLTIDGKRVFEAVRGKEIFAEDNYLDLDMTDLPVGVYYLSIQSKSGETQYLKFIKI